ncbi:cyclin-Y-like protein 2 [Cebus imitator]|uniref:cyclin-Y-like protein 2 n=1 Tax=Cebus imitator TaxID=2715852 RepID=UPI00080A1716|nr:cyclin-Y-like protein 2 [Cebus imitator]
MSKSIEITENRGQVPEEYFRFDPTHIAIYRFMRILFCVKRLNADLAIISLVYIKRLLKCADINICPSNWKRIIFGATLLAIKVGSNVAVCNKDLCKLFEKMTVDNMNELQRWYLELINYNTNISLSVYTRYYFCLRALAFRHGLSLPYYLLDRERAWDLKALSRMQQDGAFYTARKTGSLSAGDLIGLQRAKAVLS